MDEKRENMVVNVEPRKRSKKRLLILVLLLLITGVMLSTSTYAWFTANKTVSVSNIRVNVAAKNGIQISADAQNWKSILQTTDLTGAHTGGVYTTAVNQIPTALEPVSTVGEIANGKMKMFYGEVKTSGNDFILTATQTDEIDNALREESNPGKFIAFDIFLKVTTATQTYLTSASGITTDDANDNGIKNASRIAFLNEGNTAEGTAIGAVQSLGNTSSSIVPMIWEPNYDSHTAAALANATTLGIKNKTNSENPVAIADGDGYLVPLDGVKAAITEGAGILLADATTANHNTLFDTVTVDNGDAGTKVGTENLWYTTKAGWTGTEPVTYHDFVNLSAGITKIRVYVWVEGQDIDCENTASGGNIIFNLQLTTDNGEGA